MGVKAETQEKQENEKIGNWQTTFHEIIQSWREESESSQKFEEQFSNSEIGRYDPLSEMSKSEGIESYETPERFSTTKSNDFHTQIKIPKARNNMYEKYPFAKTSNEYSPSE